MTMSSNGGIVSAEHPLAAQAGCHVLQNGGNAIDAAIAANAMMGVVAPMTCGIGGDLFAIVHSAKDGQLYGLNASGFSGSKFSLDDMKKRGFEEMPLFDIHAVSVPGAVDGWAKLSERFGSVPLKECLLPAVSVAERGYPVAEWVGIYWAATTNLLSQCDESARIYLKDNGDNKSRSPPGEGDVMTNPDLAWSYRQIMAHGRDAFYKGEIAARIGKFMDDNDGPLLRKDLEDFESEWVDPISTTYRGWKVYEIPPQGQGVAALMMLNIMETFPFPTYDHNGAEDLHHKIEAKNLAYQDMIRFTADMKFSNVPLEQLLSKERAKERASLIDENKANPAQKPDNIPSESTDTTYLSVVDKEGNMVSLIQSIYHPFGSGLTAPGTGFALQNRANLFSLDPTHPNSLEKRKRPLHTIIPGFMEKGDTKIAFGIMGGWNQSQAHAQFVSNVVDHGMNIQQALEMPRFTKPAFDGVEVFVEARISKEAQNALKEKGHDVKEFSDYCAAMGGGQAVQRFFQRGVNYGASDPRKDGAAIPEASF